MRFELQFPIADALVVNLMDSYIDALEMATKLFGPGLALDEIWDERPQPTFVYAHRLIRDDEQVAVIVARLDAPTKFDPTLN
jgi:hypothetical protein